MCFGASADLHRAQDGDRGGVVHDALPEDERVQHARLLGSDDLQHRHCVCRCKDGPQRQAILQEQGPAS